MLHRFPIFAMLFALLWLCPCTSAQPAADPYQTAVALVQAQKFDQAIPMIQQVLATNPGNLKARNLLGIALSAVGRREDANREFRKVLETDPSFIPVLKNLALNELALGRYSEAEPHLRKALKAAPQDPVVHLGLAEVDHAKGRHDEAVAHYRASGNLYLQDPAAAIRYTRSCLTLGQREAGRTALARMAPANSPRTHFDAGVLLAELEQYEAAANEFRLAESGYPDPYQAGFNLALAYSKAKQHRAAAETAERMIAAGYKKAEILNLLSQVYESLNRTKEAYDALRLAIEVDPKHEPSYIDLMTLCIHHENPDLGLEISEVAMKAMPDSQRVRLHRGVVLAMRGQLEDADAEFLAAAKADPKAPLSYIAVALIRIQTNRLADAIALLRERRKINANDYYANWFLGEAIGRLRPEPGSPDELEAVAALESAARTAGHAAPPRTLLGKFLAWRGDAERAAAMFEEALRLDPEDMTAAYQLALICRKRGDTKRAEELFAKVSKAKSAEREEFTQQALVRIIREGAK